MLTFIAENHYSADYPDEEVCYDDEFGRNPYRFRTRNASDDEEYDVNDFVDEGTDDADADADDDDEDDEEEGEEEQSRNPWRKQAAGEDGAAKLVEGEVTLVHLFGGLNTRGY